MAVAPRILLAVYLVALFAALPLLPSLVGVVTSRFGPGAVTPPLALAGLLAAAVLLRKLITSSRARSPRSVAGLAGIGLFTALCWRYLASSPVGRFHLFEYGILAVLLLRAFPGRPRPKAARILLAWAAAAAIGVLDEGVQYVLPNRVFDLYDIALNAGAALAGLLAAAWWRSLDAPPGDGEG